ncbi:MAG: hypothetical protein K2I72_01920, partial [Bacilli bacterium]|nr:hypothetical protein [Bacilli bacterium]
MKKHNILKVLFITILAIVLCTWIFPSAQFQETLVEGERMQAGLFDLFAYPMVVLQYFGSIVLFIATCGIFYGVAYRIPAYHQLVQKITDGFKGMEHIFLATVIILISVIVSVTGISVPILFVFPFIIDVVLKMGYNRLVAATVTVGPTVAGIAGTTLGVMTTGYLNQVLELAVFDEMVSKVVILIIFVILLIAQVILYGKKTKNVTIQMEEKSTPSKATEIKEKVEVAKKEKTTGKKTTGKKTTSKTNSKTTNKKSSSKNSKSTGKRGRPPKSSAAMAKDNSETLVIPTKSEKKANIWPFVIVFDLVLIILALSAFDWNGLFDITWFSEAKEAVLTYEIFDFQIFGKLLGVVEEFGNWSLGAEMTAIILIATCVLALVYRVKWEDFIDGICDGFKKAMGPAAIILITYVVLVLVTFHPFQLVFTKFLLDLTSGINVVTMTLVAMLASFFNIDMSYVVQNTLPYVKTVITDAGLYPLI